MEIILVFLLLLCGVSSHTWLEALRQIGSNGAFQGQPGYPRGYIARNDSKFSDDALTYRITTRDPSTPLCHPSQQVATGYNNSLYPRLTASPGSFVALQYQENGHTSAPQVPEGRPFRSGNVYVYASTTLRDEKFLSVHGNWTSSGSLESGKLVATHFFDDDLCFQDQGSGPTKINAQRKAAAQGLRSVTCQTDIHIPQEIDSKVVALYWVWEWDLWPNTEKTAPETYTACSEITISDGNNVSSSIDFDESLPLNERAVQNQLAIQYEVLELGTGTSAPPLVTSLYSSSTASAAAPTVSPMNMTTVSSPTLTATSAETGFATVRVPSATIIVTVTAVVAL
ncbi:hypothetical protein Daus18300_003920 [Diaporthe australafricana]|uniref:DUF7492 domain-containing protein n=1 Tax=Diaporthe australafricana TaxID=127596 RepID=A0ABR3XD09_9PEZI